MANHMSHASHRWDTVQFCNQLKSAPGAASSNTSFPMIGGHSKDRVLSCIKKPGTLSMSSYETPGQLDYKK